MRFFYLRPAIALFLLVFTAQAATGQDLFTVKAGVFRDVRGADFKEIEDLGYVYDLETGGSEIEVYVGQFTQQQDAVKVAGELNKRGFRNATVLNIPDKAGEALTMIQFAYHAASRSVPWKKYEPLGPLHVESVDGNIKVLTGPFPSREDAVTKLAALKKQGYSDAFVKQVPSLKLIPIDEFETGIKKPLIPFTYSSRPETNSTNSTGSVTPPASPNVLPTVEPITGGGAAAPPVVASPPPSPAPAAAPVENKPPAAAAPPALPADVTDMNLPAINPATKRSSTAELQKVLKEKGYYTGSLDGLYGPGTAAAYAKAWDDMPEIRKYRLLTGAAFASVDASRNSVTQWPEVAVLLTIVEDLSAGNTSVDRARLLAQERNELFESNEKLPDVATTRSRNWASTAWENLELWATEDPLHAQIFTAFRVSYHQSQVRLEEHFAARGLGTIEARNLAIAMMQNLTGAQLDRFL